MAYVLNEGQGGLFKNTKKSNDKQPDFTGNCKVDGKEWRIAGWTKKTAKGQPYLSLKLSEPRATETGGEDPPF